MREVSEPSVNSPSNVTRFEATQQYSNPRNNYQPPISEPNYDSESDYHSESDYDNINHNEKRHDPNKPRPMTPKGKQKVNSNNTSINNESKATNTTKYKPLVYTNHVLNEIQKNLHAINTVEGLVNIFFIINMMYYDNETRQFSINNYVNFDWIIAVPLNELYKSFHDTVNSFLEKHSKDLEVYSDSLEVAQWRESEIYTTPLFEFTLTEHDRYRMQKWELWDEAVKWENKLRQNLNYIIESTDEQCVFHDLCHDIDHSDINHEYKTLYNEYHKLNPALANRYNSHYIYHFANNRIVKITYDKLCDIKYLQTVSESCKDIRHRISCELVKIQKLMSTVTDKHNNHRSVVTNAILRKVSVEPYFERYDFKNGYLIGIADRKVLDLETLQVEPKTREHDICHNMPQTEEYIFSSDVDRHDDAMMELFNLNWNVYVNFMMLLAMAFATYKYGKYLYIITITKEFKELVINLLNVTLGPMYKHLDGKILKSKKFDVHQLKDKRIVSFDNVKSIPFNVTEKYFNSTMKYSSGGKYFRFDTNFIIFADDVPYINPLEQHLIYQAHLTGNPNGKWMEDRNININWRKYFLDTLLFYSKHVRNYENEILPPAIIYQPKTVKPLNSKHLDKNTSDDESSYDTKKLTNVKSAEQLKLEKRLFGDFLIQRVEFNSGKSQHTDEFRYNVNLFLHQMGYSDVVLSHITIGRYLSRASKDMGRHYERIPDPASVTKTVYLYSGVVSYPQDIEYGEYEQYDDDGRHIQYNENDEDDQCNEDELYDDNEDNS